MPRCNIVVPSLAAAEAQIVIMQGFLKVLESALRFGNPILIQDVECLDPILNAVLNKEIRRTGGRVLIRLGNQDIDFSPAFAMFLSTRSFCGIFSRHLQPCRIRELHHDPQQFAKPVARSSA